MVRSDLSGYIVDLTLLHVVLGLTANRKPPFFSALPAVSGECSLTAFQVEEFTIKIPEDAALEVKECIDNKGVTRICQAMWQKNL